jgi:leucyl-tRNA synthetase
VEWTETGVAGAQRFVQRLYRIATTIAAEPRVEQPGTFMAEAKKLRQSTHRSIAAVTEALDSFAFNLAVARIHELSSALVAAPTQEVLWARREAANTIALLVAPMMPHLAEEIFATLNPGAGLAAQQPWPQADPALLTIDEVTLAVQINGKLKTTIQLPVGTLAPTAVTVAKQAVSSALDGRTLVKEIHVPDRIVNFVVKP